MGIVIDMMEWKRRRRERELRKQRSKNQTPKQGGSYSQRIKEALMKWGSHRKNTNNSKDGDK